MSHLFQVDRVNFLCSCGLLKPITQVYFCRHCIKIRCGNCGFYELDTLFCPNCLENMPSTEARLKKNRCANCLDCPCCFHTLSARTSSIQSPSADDPNKMVSKKVYYLACTGCRWTTRDVGIKDQTIATGGWGELENPNYKEIQSLLEHYKTLGQLEKFEKEKKKSSKNKSSYRSFSMDKYNRSSNYSSMIGHKSVASLSSYSAKCNTSMISEITPAEAVADCEGLPDSIYTEPVVLSNITTIAQRLVSPEWQPEKSADMYPMHKHILVKRSLRDRPCDHNLFKPEYNPNNIKFKIQLGAFYHVPEVRIVKQVELKFNVETTVQLSLCNPTAHDMTVVLLPFIPEAYLAQQEESEKQASPTGLSRISEVPKEKCDIELTADVVLPLGQLTLAARDDTAEYDDHDTTTNYRDDPQVVAWRRVNKVGVNLQVTPHTGVKEAKIGFILRYDYTNTVAVASSESRTVTINVPVLVNVGPVIE